MKSKETRAILGAVAVLLIIIFVVRALSSESFTTEKWINATPRMRYRLMDALAKNGQLIGLNEVDVTRMLGDPDGSSHGQVWYCERYYGEDGVLKKRYAGASKCLYIQIANGRVETAEFKGS